MKNSKSLEEAIKEQFPEATIYEVRNTRFGKYVLGVVHAHDEDDEDHIVEWYEDGRAYECTVDSRDYLEICWDPEQEKPTFVKAKLLLHNEAFDIRKDGSSEMP